MKATWHRCTTSTSNKANATSSAPVAANAVAAANLSDPAAAATPLATAPKPYPPSQAVTTAALSNSHSAGTSRPTVSGVVD
jgi:hypothetical protein